MNRKHIVLFVAPSLPSFVKNDIRILSEKYNVIQNIYNWKKKQLTPFYLIHQIFFFLKKAPGAKAIFISFGGLWSAIPSLIGKITGTPVFIILNGTDCAALPALKYGSLRKKTIRTACRISYQSCDLLLPVSESLVKIKNTYHADDQDAYQGFKHFFPKLKTRHMTIHNGLDTDFWKRPENVTKEAENFVAVFNNNQYFLKGGDLIMEVAKKFPDCRFRIAGCNTPVEEIDVPSNVTFLGKIKPDELKELYSRSRYHLQLSIFEGFGYALGEAMLCECIPIVSSVNMLPEIAGEAGFVLEKRDVRLLENTIRKALNVQNSHELGKIARQHIVNNYSLERRKDNLLSIAEKYINNAI